MARYTGPVCRLCRREGIKLFLKGDRCYTDKCAVTHRGTAPGQHGKNKKKLSGYGVQLREKQKAKRIYGILENQFSKYYDNATAIKGVAGENLLRLLELRLDNVVFKLGYSDSRQQARQLVTHGHFLVNGKKVNIPSYKLNVNDEISVKESSKSVEKFKVFAANPKAVPAFLQSDFENLKGRVVALPVREDITIPVNETLIIELYSK
ncbi:MAG: 30S ribosomal protein S4 [Oscillospiraceae bacterium]|nr:30S ribosomal protein S4 [Oscillospiraceae bacterium]